MQDVKVFKIIICLSYVFGQLQFVTSLFYTFYLFALFCFNV